MIKPISPNEVTKAKAKLVPDEVLEVFNELIAINFDGHSSRVEQDAVASLVAMKMNIRRDAVFAQKYLDVEDIYREAGWEVYYDKPGYNETYGAYFRFTKPK